MTPVSPIKTVDRSSVSCRPLAGHRRSGLTLLELVAVVLLLGLIASVSAIGFGGSLKAAQSQKSLETWLFYDQQCRTLADRSNQRVMLIYNPDAQTISRRVGAKTAESQTLAGDVELFEITLLDLNSTIIEPKQNQVHYFPTGQSQSYLVQRSDTAAQLVIGATGQHSVVQDSKAIRKLFTNE